MNIATNCFAKVGDFVDEGDLCCEKCIGGVFDQLGGFQRCNHHRSFN